MIAVPAIFSLAYCLLAAQEFDNFSDYLDNPIESMALQIFKYPLIVTLGNLMSVVAIVIMIELYQKYESSFAKKTQLGITTPSEFTVMITNVHQDDPIEKIEDFIFNELIANNLPPCHVIKINKASFLGNLARIEHRLLEVKKIISVVEENLEMIK